MDGQGVLGYCENCGIVYALKEKLKGTWDTETPRRFEGGITSDSKEAGSQRRVSPVDTKAPVRSPGSYWRCPDCDAEIRSDNDSDLKYAKREHIREYHPNRSTA